MKPSTFGLLGLWLVIWFAIHSIAFTPFILGDYPWHVKTVGTMLDVVVLGSGFKYILRKRSSPESLPAPSPSTVSHDNVFMAVSESHWADALSELDSSARSVGLWAKCFAQCDGDDPRARAMYLRERAAQLASSAPGFHSKEAAPSVNESADEVITKAPSFVDDKEQMRELQISFDGDKYRYQDYRYDKLSDAVSYALLDKKRGV